MRIKLPIIAALAVTLAGGTAAIAATQAPKGAEAIAFFNNVHWDDDDDVIAGVRTTAMPVPSEKALKGAGMVRVTEVERDDGQIEVEGYDRHGREMEIKMDAAGQRVLAVDMDDDVDMRRVVR